MLPLIVKVINSLFLAISSFLIVKNLVGNKIDMKKNKIYIILDIIILIIPSCILFKTEYSGLVFLTNYLISIGLWRRTFRISPTDSIIICSIAMIFVAIADFSFGTIETHFFNYKYIRTNIPITIFNNILVSISSYGFSCIPFIKNRTKYITKKISETNKGPLIIFAFLLIIVIAILYYNITSIFKLNVYYTITLISLAIFVLLYYLYIYEYSNYEKLKENYDILFDCVQRFENWIDDEQQYRHELKNNLSIIRNLTKEKKAIEKIDEMLGMNINVEDRYIETLKNVPKGGLKGIIYYKIAIAANENVNFIVDVSEKTTKKLKQLSKSNLKELCIILGIYIDNALEAASLTTSKNVTFEIYTVNNSLNFVISNTYDKLIPIKKMNKKGYSTKGFEHGRGLYYAHKILKSNKKIKAEQYFKNKFYIQKIIIEE